MFRLSLAIFTEIIDTKEVPFCIFVKCDVHSKLLTYLRTYLLTYSLTPWSRVLLEKLTGFHLVKKFLAFMETEVSLPLY